MLGPGRYLLGVLEIALLVGFAGLGASALRARLLPGFQGAPAHLATAVLSLALLLWVAELLGSFGGWQVAPYLVGMGLVGAVCWRLSGGWHGGRCRGRTPRPQAPSPMSGPAGRGVDPAVVVSLALASIAVVHFAAGAKTRLSTGMTGFDSTWYHGPFAAGFLQSGNTWDLHFIAPQFLAWFYPANGEIFHSVGMLAFGRDIVSPLLNIGWFVGCLVACWCSGRPYRVAPSSLALGAVALSVPALADQAGEARNDIVGIFFLLSAVAIALNAGAVRWDEQQAGREEGNESSTSHRGRGLPIGALAVVGLCAGLAAGDKLNLLLPAAVLVLGFAAITPRKGRWRALAAGGLAALAGGGYWYLRNLVHSGNPLPWVDSLGPISLPAPDQALGGREAHSVVGYLTDGAVWSDWFLPGLHDGLWFLWPLLLAAALAGLALCLWPGSRCDLAPDSGAKSQRERDPVLALAGLVGLAAALAWFVAPTSASGPDGMPRGFESGLRYLAPALVLGLTLLPATPPLRRLVSRLAGSRTQLSPVSGHNCVRVQEAVSHGWIVLGVVAVALVVAAGYPLQRHYLVNRYADPTFTAPGLNAAFAWSRDVSDAGIATTSTRQYPLFGTDLSNHVQFIGEEQPHGGFEAPSTCRAWRKELNAGNYDYVIASRDRIEPGKPPYPPQASWTEGPAAKLILRKPPTVIFQLTERLDPSACAG